MPDSQGLLSEAERDLFAAHLNKFITEKGPIVCVVCRSKTWSMVPHVQVSLRLGGDGTVHITGSAYPTVSAVCDNCGHTIGFLAEKVGIKFNV